VSKPHANLIVQTPATTRTLATCSAVHTLHDGLSDITYVLLPILAQTFNLSLAQVGLIRAAHRAAMATFQIPAGLVAERFGERNLLAFGTACAGLAFLMIAKGLPEGWAALSVPLILIGGMAGKLACGFLAERIGIIRTVVITEIATGCGILATLALPNLAAFALLPLIGIALNGTSSVLYATIGDLVDKARLPRAFGLFYTLGSACGIAAPLGYGVLGDRAGIETAIALVGSVVFLTVPLALMLRPAVQASRPGS